MSGRENEDRLFKKCYSCGHIASELDLEKTMYVCRNCGHFIKIPAFKRIKFIADAGTFHEINAHIGFADPISFPGYERKHLEAQERTQIKEAIVTGIGMIEGRKIALGVMESDFIMGSMGVALGEKICLLFERGLYEGCPVVLFTASGGARMQEGIAALLQMSKIASVVAQLNENGIPLITVLTDPTTGGVAASFAMLGDIILAEPGALIGFAGPRVVSQTIKQDLPEGFQKSENVLQCGFIDKIVHRNEMRRVLMLLADMHSNLWNKNAKEKHEKTQSISCDHCANAQGAAQLREGAVRRADSLRPFSAQARRVVGRSLTL